jgi:ribosome-binding ATPase YchF (GTP1/OBG family)
VRDVRILEDEMILSDLDVAEKRLAKIEKELQSSKDKHTPEKDALLRCKEALEQEKPLRLLEFSDDERKTLSGFRFLSQKPVMVILNTDENDIGKPVPEEIQKHCDGHSFPLLALSGKIEEEISECSPEEQAELLEGMGIAEPALPKFIATAYGLLDLISFFTMNDKEIRAWSIHRGATAWEAAGKVHTDMQRGFIRAEIVAFEDFKREGGMKAAKEKHLMHLEGKDHVIEDGDIIFFRFNV